MHVVGAMAFQVAAGKAQGRISREVISRQLLLSARRRGTALVKLAVARQRATVSQPRTYARKAEVAV